MPEGTGRCNVIGYITLTGVCADFSPSVMPFFLSVTLRRKALILLEDKGALRFFHISAKERRSPVRDNQLGDINENESKGNSHFSLEKFPRPSALCRVATD